MVGATEFPRIGDLPYSYAGALQLLLVRAQCNGHYAPAALRSARTVCSSTGASRSRPRALVPYLSRWASPSAICRRSRGRPGSTHGYDITDHDRLSPELGGEGDYDAARRAPGAHGMGLVLDVVPNHMASTRREPLVARRPRERALLDPRALLRHRLAPVKPEMRGSVLLPILGDQYGDVLERANRRRNAEAARSPLRQASPADRAAADPVAAAAHLEALRRTWTRKIRACTST